MKTLSKTEIPYKLFLIYSAIIAVNLTYPLIIQATPAPQTLQFKTFTEWCTNKSQLPPQTKHTVEVILKEIGTENCQLANQKLNQQTRLFLDANQITDITPLASLKNLQGLNLAMNQISDITPLSSLTKLQQLSLTENQISNLKPLSSLTELFALDIAENQISDLQPLANLRRLYRLDLGYNQITNIRPLASLYWLSTLSLVGNHIRDITPLQSLRYLKVLVLEDNPIDNKTCPVQPDTICSF